MILMAATIILTTVTTIPTIPTIVSIIISFTFRKFSIVSPSKIPEVLKMITIHTLYKFRIHLQLLSVSCNNDAHKMPKAGILALAPPPCSKCMARAKIIFIMYSFGRKVNRLPFKVTPTFIIGNYKGQVDRFQ